MLIDDKLNGRPLIMGDLIAPLGFIFMIGTASALAAVPVSILVGFVAVPVFRFMRRHDYRSGVSDAIAGLLLGSAAILILSILHFEMDALVFGDYIYAVLLVLIAGPVSGIVVGRVERRKETDVSWRHV